MSERHVARLATVAFVTCGDDVLLLRHPPQAERFAGLWNGVGGHVEAGDVPAGCSGPAGPTGHVGHVGHVG